MTLAAALSIDRITFRPGFDLKKLSNTADYLVITAKDLMPALKSSANCAGVRVFRSKWWILRIFMMFSPMGFLIPQPCEGF